MICRTTPGVELHCLWAGPIIRLALGFSVTNTDLLQLTPVTQRGEYLEHVRKIVEGSASVLYRDFTSAAGTHQAAQGIALPFADRPRNASRYFLMHTNWRPAGDDWIIGNVQVDLQAPYGRKTINFMGPQSDSHSEEICQSGP